MFSISVLIRAIVFEKTTHLLCYFIKRLQVWKIYLEKSTLSISTAKTSQVWKKQPHLKHVET